MASRQWIAIAAETKSKARRKFWITTLVCIGGSILALASVAAPGFHYKSQQTGAITTIVVLMFAWVIFGGLLSLFAFVIPQRTTTSTEPSPTPQPPLDVTPVAPRIPRKRRPATIGILVFGGVLGLEIVMGGGRSPLGSLLLASVLACLALLGEMRR